jgi:pimeloyl-ACP methyl ester carboxylesterase
VSPRQIVRPDDDELIAPDAPNWFKRAVSTPSSDHFVTSGGVAIHYLAWGEPGRRGLVFVHGGAAHAHWWAHIASRFASTHRVVAVDLSGHGDSDFREDGYTLERFAAEVMAAASDAGIDGPPVVIGHSFGGFVTTVTAALHADDVAGAIVCDSPIAEPDPEVGSHRSRRAFGKVRVYSTREEALARFHPEPRQKNELTYVLRYIGPWSLRQVAGGWSWKFDHRIFEGFENGTRALALPYLSEVRCRYALLRSEHGLVTPDIGQAMYEKLGRVAPVIEIPQAGHHAMLDEPLVLLTAIRTLLADWDHSTPQVR